MSGFVVVGLVLFSTNLSNWLETMLPK